MGVWQMVSAKGYVEPKHRSKSRLRMTRKLAILLSIIALVVIGVFLYQRVFLSLSSLSDFWKKERS